MAAADDQDDYDLDFLEDDDDTVPFGANAKNRQLDKEIKAAERKLLQVEADTEQQTNRVKIMDEHLKNVQQELKHTQALVETKSREKDNESHMLTLGEKAQARLKKDIRKAQANIAELNDRISTNQNKAFQCREQVQALKDGMSWNEQELAAWMEKTKVIEEDAAVLEKYSRADEAKIKELTLQIDKLTDASTKGTRDLQSEALETQAQRIGLDKAAVEFQRLHAEQQELTAAWEKVIAQMEQRDAEIAQEAEHYSAIRQNINEQILLLKEKEGFLQEEHKSNAELEREMHLTERAMLKTSADVVAAEKRLEQFKDELASLRTMLSRVTADSNSKKKQAASLKAQKEAKQDKAHKLTIEIEETQAKYKAAISKGLTAEERTRQLETMLADEEQDMEAVVREVASARQEQYTAATQAAALKNRETLLKQEVTAVEAAIRNADSRLVTVEKEIGSQGQLLYQQDFQLTTLERTLAKLQGKRSKTEEEAFQKQLAELKSTLAQQQKTQQLLLTQIGRTDDFLRAGKRKHDQVRQERLRWEERLQELEMTMTATNKELAKVIAAKEDLVVDENVLKLEIRRVRQALNQKADQVFTLEQRKVQLKAAMRERLEEIAIHKELIGRQLKDSQADAASINKELKERFSKIDQLRKRYEIIISSMESDDDGQVKTQAYFVVKHAQQREELQRQGDALDTKIRKGEREVRALENTLRMMDGRNAKLKKSLRRVDGDSEEQQRMNNLKTQYATAMDQYKHKRRELKEHTDQLEALQAALNAMTHEVRVATTRLDTAEAEMHELDRELQDQQGKLERALRRAQQLIASHRSQAGVTDDQESLEEMDVHLRQLDDFTTRVMRELDAVVAQHPDLAVQKQMLFQQAGIQVPRSTPGSRTSSIAGSSRASSTASKRSVLRERTPKGSMPATANDAAAMRQLKDARVVSTTTFEFGLAGSSASLSASKAPSRAASRQQSRASARLSSRAVASSRSTRPPSVAASHKTGPVFG
eukprot:TRINITY_DN10794_c0_g1_i2.p1 TRINITY_DN10794_c0_g1~~TRINITY_DN10794_c0_g1_i2.p1  ORF type:complete len:996 (+),score=362.39 TRINITY_DN10794_c0_g1_i2:30-3017(+)